MTITVKIETITPGAAERWLNELNESNRPLSKPVVAKYAAQMAAGEWMLTHQGIAFAQDGRLLDGQHRLAAIVRYGGPVAMMVARGCDRSTFVAIDGGAGRTASDLISISGDDVTGTVKLAAVTARLLRFTPSGVWVTAGMRAPKHVVFAAYTRLRVRPDWPIIEHNATASGYREAGCHSHALWAALRVVAALGVGEAKAAEFFAGVSSGANLAPGDARLALRKRLLDNRVAQRKMVEGAETEAIVRAWNAYHDHRTLTRIQVDGSAMPTMAGCVGIDLGIRAQ